MGWEGRSRGGLYYTRSRRVGGHVVREYVGTGLLGQLAARLDAAEREQRADQRERSRAERDRLAAADAPVADLCATTDTLARAALLLAGYHRHDRGEWRRRRGQA